MRVLVMTVAHPPQDARIRERQIEALRSRGHEVTYAAPFTAFDADPAVDAPEVDPVDLPHGWDRDGEVFVDLLEGWVARAR